MQLPITRNQETITTSYFEELVASSIFTIINNDNQSDNDEYPPFMSNTSINCQCINEKYYLYLIGFIGLLLKLSLVFLLLIVFSLVYIQIVCVIFHIRCVFVFVSLLRE